MEEVFFSIARDIKQRLADTDSRAEVSIYLVLNEMKMNEMKMKEILDLLIFICTGNLPSLVLRVQPTAIRINPADQATGAGQTAQKSACCGS